MSIKSTVQRKVEQFQTRKVTASLKRADAALAREQALFGTDDSYAAYMSLAKARDKQARLDAALKNSQFIAGFMK